MLGAFTKGLGLPDPIVRVAEPSWVIAETIHLGDGMSMLAIYRSTWLRDTDKGYEQVRTLLERSEHEQIYRAAREDEGMMHRSAEWIVYVLDPVAAPGPVASKAIDFIKQWGEPLHPMDVPAEASARLMLLDGVI